MFVDDVASKGGHFAAGTNAVADGTLFRATIPSMPPPRSTIYAAANIHDGSRDGGGTS